MGAFIKAEEVRAGDTLRVTFEVRAASNGPLTCLYLADNVLPAVLRHAATIERLDAPLKVGDRVRLDRLGSIPGEVLWTDGEFATCRAPGQQPHTCLVSSLVRVPEDRR